MISKEKQIEEMAQIAKRAIEENASWRCKCDICVANIIDGVYCDESAVINGLYNAGYRKQSEWISVEERLPEVRQRVLLYSHHDGVNTGYRADEIGRFYVDKSYPYRPTHWMPLPEAPKGGEE
jgi:hypothetical protein